MHICTWPKELHRPTVIAWGFIMAPQKPALTLTWHLAAVVCMQTVRHLSVSDKAATAGSAGSAEPFRLPAGVSRQSMRLRWAKLTAADHLCLTRGSLPGRPAVLRLFWLPAAAWERPTLLSLKAAANSATGTNLYGCVSFAQYCCRVQVQVRSSHILPALQSCCPVLGLAPYHYREPSCVR